MQHPALAQVEGYWDGLRNGRPVPFRSEIDPRGIDRALEFAFILERIAPGVARFRLAGMHLNDLMGMEVRGMPLTSFFVPDARRKVSEALEHLFEEPAKVRFSLTAESGIGRPAMTAELMLLPLKSDLGDVSRALGCLVSEGATGRTPRRFDVTGTEIKALLGDAMGAPQQRPRHPVPPVPRAPVEPAPGLAEEAAIYGSGRGEAPPQSSDRPPEDGGDSDDMARDDAQKLRSERPYLRLVHSNS